MEITESEAPEGRTVLHDLAVVLFLPFAAVAAADPEAEIELG